MPSLFRRTDVSQSSARSMASRWAFGLMGSLSQGLTRFLYSVLIGRVLGAATLASVNSALSLALFLSLLWPTSAGQAATRFVAQLRGEGRPEQAQAVANHLGRRMLVTSLLLGVATVLGAVVVLHLDVSTAICAGILLLGYAGWSFTRGVQYGAGQIARAAVWDVAGSVAALVMLVAVLVFRAEPILLLPLALGYGAYAVICWPAPSTTPVDPELLAPMRRFLGYGVLGTLSSTGLLQLSMVSAQLAGSANTAGLYAAALSLATPATMIARTGSQVLFPSMAEAGGRQDATSMRRQTDLVTRGLTVSMLAVFGALALASPLVVRVLYGERFAGTQDILPILLLAVMFTTLPVGAVNRLNATGVRGARFISLVAAGGLVLAVVLWIVLGPVLGVIGVAVGYLTASTLTSLGPILRCWREDRQQWGGVVLRLLVGLALIVGGVVWSTAVRPPLWTGVVLAVGFVLVWALINIRDITRLRSARGGAPVPDSTPAQP
ncbi:lipopolysaccharide biosynthesis protein [Tersicoccus sp. MR15.9]|uniref:lipopolysaccharide biosynthesis protein n=1 Tax=Tersicoccus mangrovi TaxID=3121635 RepID=UPI002FE6B8A1